MRRLDDWLDHSVADGVPDGSSTVTDFAASLDALDRVVSGACAEHEEWSPRVVAGLRSALGFVAGNPSSARVLAVESAALGSEDLDRHWEMIEDFSSRLGTGAPRRPAASSERALVLSVISLIADRLRTGDEARLPEAAPELACLLLMPYLGFEDARAWADF